MSFDINPKRVKHIYAGADGKAQHVIKGYVGVNGKAQEFFDFSKVDGRLVLSKYTSVFDIDNYFTRTDTVTVLDHTGDLSVTTSNPSIATATISGNVITITYVARGTATITVHSATSKYYTATSKDIAVDLMDLVDAYGIAWNTDGTYGNKCVRTYAAINFSDPIPYGYRGSSSDPSSPFDNIMPWAGMVKVEDAEAGTLVSIPKYYYKLTKTDGVLRLLISDTYFTGSRVSPAHRDRGDGKGERNIVYVGRYLCGKDTYGSVTSERPKRGGTINDFRTNIHNLGSAIWQWDYSMLMTILMLYLVEYADWNAKMSIGNGKYPYEDLYTNGVTDRYPYHTGMDDEPGYSQYRWIANLWSLIYSFCDGLFFDESNVFAVRNPADYGDTTKRVQVGSRLSSSGYIKDVSLSNVDDFEWIMLPSALTSDQYSSEAIGNNYLHDYQNANSIFVSGWSKSYPIEASFTYFGNIFNMSFYQDTADGSILGSRLMKLP